MRVLVVGEYVEVTWPYIRFRFWRRLYFMSGRARFMRRFIDKACSQWRASL